MLVCMYLLMCMYFGDMLIGLCEAALPKSKMKDKGLGIMNVQSSFR